MTNLLSSSSFWSSLPDLGREQVEGGRKEGRKGGREEGREGREGGREGERREGERREGERKASHFAG